LLLSRLFRWTGLRRTLALVIKKRTKITTRPDTPSSSIFPQSLVTLIYIFNSS
jgi:hypothetical protein